MCTSYMVCLACNRAPFITQYAVYCNVVNRLLECSSQEASKTLIMREYDTTISPLSDSQENSWFGLSFGLWKEKNMNP